MPAQLVYLLPSGAGNFLKGQAMTFRFDLSPYPTGSSSKYHTYQLEVSFMPPKWIRFVEIYNGIDTGRETIIPIELILNAPESPISDKHALDFVSRMENVIEQFYGKGKK